MQTAGVISILNFMEHNPEFKANVKRKFKNWNIGILESNPSAPVRTLGQYIGEFDSVNQFMNEHKED